MSNSDKVKGCLDTIRKETEQFRHNLKQKMKILEALSPEKVLSRGYAIISGKISPGSVVRITTRNEEIEAEIKTIQERR